MNTRHTDIASLLATGAYARGAEVAIRNKTGRHLSYSELYAKTHDIAGSLRAVNIGTRGKRPRFGIVMPNGADMAVVLLGTALAGEATPFNAFSTATEFSNFFALTRIDALIVCEADVGSSVAAAQRAGLPILRVSANLQIAGIDSQPAQVRPPIASDIALVLMTSGSTGRPKIVPLTHSNVCCSAHEVASSLKLTPEDVCLSMWEQFHIGGLVDLLLAPLASGGSIIATGGFNAPEFFEILASDQPTWYQAVPTTLNDLVVHAERRGIVAKPNTLRLIRSVAAALSPLLMERVVDMFDVPVIRTFGMTEASPLITTTPLPPLPQKPGSVGKPCGTQISIFGPSGPITAACSEGEVGIRGDNVFHGYEHDEEANLACFKDGWFLTGDLGYIDTEGDLFLTGRSKQLINRGGEKISPQEVDEVMARHPAVLEVATFGVKHRTLGEDIVAAVVLRKPSKVAELRRFVRKNLAPFKVPQRILFFENLPRNSVGKVDRLMLAKIAETEIAKNSSAFTGPRNAIERLLAVIWALELNLPQVDIHQHFTDAGGDSLSMTRILLAMEAALSCDISPDLLAENSTIADISAELAGLDFRIEGEVLDIEEKAAAALNSVLVGTVGYDGSLNELRAAIKSCSSRVGLRAMTEGLVVYATAAELATLLDATSSVTVGSNAKQSVGAIENMQLKRAYNSWRRELHAEISKVPRDRAWLRRVLCEGALLYGDPMIPTSEKCLIVGFTGNFGRLMQPTYRILSNLDPKRFDLLLLRDPKKSLFVSGGPGLGHDINSVAAYANSFYISSGYASAIAFGTSGGGPAAIYTGLVYAWEKVVVVNSPAPTVRPELESLLAPAVAAAGSHHCPIFVVHSTNSTDLQAAAALRKVIPFARVEMLEEYSTHNLLNEAYINSRLETLFTRWFDMHCSSY